MARNTKRVQMDFGALCGYQNEIIWDLLNHEQADILKEKILSLISDPSNYGERMRTTLFKSVWAQRKYTNRNLLFSIFYVLVTDTETRAAALSSTKFSCHPVFRMRKCTARSNSSNCCMIYVDECGRVYQNWSDYLRNNVLPQGIFVAPRFGVYTFDGTNIDLFTGYTAASQPAAQLIQKADRAFALGGFASAAITVASICSLPVTGPLLAIGTAVGLASAGYSTLRSGSTLLDRSEHEQSISLDDRQARSNWIGLAGGAVGCGASAATGALARSAAAGKNVSKITTVMVNGMNISSCVFSGSGVANSVLEMILKQEDDEEITAMDVLQLAASLAMFTHSVKNFRSAQSIVREAQNGRIQSYREGLSNRQRKMFDKMAKETMRIRGADRGRIDVIRSVREMPSKQYLNDLHKINRQLNEQKIRPAFGGADKPVMLNNDVAVDTGVLRNSVQHKVGPDVLSQVKQPIPVGSVAKGIPAKSSSMESGFQNIKNSVQRKSTSVIKDINYSEICLCSGKILTCIEFGHILIKCINNPAVFRNSVQSLAKELVDKCFRYVMGLAASFIERQLFGINIIIPAEHLIQALHEIIKPFKIKTKKYIESKVDDIIKWLRSFFMSNEYFHKFKEMESIMEMSEITFKQITLYSGKVIRFAELGNSVLEHIENAEEVLNISRELPDEVFYAVVDLAKEFIDGKLKEIEKAIQMKIPSETVMRKITENTKQYKNTSGEFIKSQRATILNSLRLFFSSEEFLKNFIQEALKDKVSVSDCGRQFFDLIFDIDDFKDVIESMYKTFDNDTFRLLLKLANAFVENKLPDIRELLKITISTEDVLHKILVRCLKNRTDVISPALERDFGKMLNLLENYYRSINPNSNYDMLKRCEICKGAYAICVV